MESSSRQAALERVIAELGYSFDGPIRIGGDYVSVVRDGATAYVSGQVPRVGETVVVTGRAGTGAHTHTSLGVLQLPKNATVELDMVVATREAANGQ